MSMNAKLDGCRLDGDDPRVTAYALGELEGEELAVVEAAGAGQRVAGGGGGGAGCAG